MKFKDLDIQQFIKDYSNKELYPTSAKLGKKYGVSDRTIRTWRAKLEDEGYSFKVDRNINLRGDSNENNILARLRESNISKDTIISEQKKEIQKLSEAPPMATEERIEFRKLRDQLTGIKKELREAEKIAMTSDSLMEVIHGTNNSNFGKVPDWMTPKRRSKSTHGMPCLFLSDIHFDENVDPAQIGFCNEFNREIAEKRIQHTFNTSIDILFNRTVNPQYDAMIICLGGDLLSGNIHEELRETNDAIITQSIIRLTDLLISGISLHLKYFDRIYVPCVVGNHGRLDKNKKFKNRVFENYEWLIYQYLQRHFYDDKRVHFLIPDGPDAAFDVYDSSFLLTHGDQFRGGSGISGIFSPLMLGYHRKQKKQASISNAFDVMMLGHFHQYIHTNKIIVNGSIKGFDEFAYGLNFDFEPPQQALFVNHPTRGMVMRTPILCDSYQDDLKPGNRETVVFQ